MGRYEGPFGAVRHCPLCGDVTEPWCPHTVEWGNMAEIDAIIGTLDTELAVQIAKERIEEWSWFDDPHGYAHERPVLMALVAALAALTQEEPDE